MNYILTKYGSDSPPQTTLHYMFKSPVYYGHMYGRDNFCDAHISKEQFDKIKETGTLKTYTRTNETYIFSGLIKCPFCGKNFTGYRHKTVKKSEKVHISPVYPQWTRGYTVGKESILASAALLSFRVRPVRVNQAPCRD